MSLWFLTVVLCISKNIVTTTDSWFMVNINGHMRVDDDHIIYDYLPNQTLVI